MEEKFRRIALIIAFIHAAGRLYSSEIAAEDLEYFEAQIRPVLVENCYKCHSADSEKIKGGFLLDSKPGMLRGGDSGPAIIPGDVEGSRLIQMIRQHPDFESMPPKTKLAQNQIEAIEQWIEMGAPDPRLEGTKTDTAISGFNLEERKQWWSLQAVQKYRPPNVNDKKWPSNDYDRFILAKLEEKDWSPAERADKRTLLRRLSFDLTGLAPTPEELDSFVKDRSKKAYAKQVDRLLASFHFGEKWARHWMDLTRYAETKSFEADYTMPYAWRYRDYLINAFNNDLPYDQFILESLAGDLLKIPRKDPLTGDNESAKGPGYIYLTDGQHGPPDLHEDQARIFDSMIDTVSKAFLGTTVACARCHDHKFDAVTTADYYSMYGLLHSSRFAYQNTVSESLQKQVRSKLESKHKSLRSLIFDAAKPDVDAAPEYLAARNELLQNKDLKNALKKLNTIPEDKTDSELEDDTKKWNKVQKDQKELLSKIITELSESKATSNLNPSILANWLKLAVFPETQNEWPELVPLITGKPKSDSSSEVSQSFAEVARSLDSWSLQGLAFTDQPQKPGSLILSSEGTNAVQTLIGDTPVGGRFASRISGAIRSPDFIIDGKPIELEVKGRFASVRLVVRNYELTGRGPTTAKLYTPVNSDHWQTISMETYLWPGQPAYLEIFQNGEAIHNIHPRDEEPEYNENAYISFRFDGGNDWEAWWKGKSAETTLAELWKKGRNNNLSANEAEVLGAFFGAGLITADIENDQKLSKSLEAYRTLAQQIPQPRFARSLIEGDPKDEPVYIRGLHKNLSKEPNPRRWLDGLGGPSLDTSGSGRLEWASYVASPDNPLTSRVIVNRIWKHLFGTGLVSTVNDFGKMGRTPTHPELLDFLAEDFIKNDWSLKSTIRKMVLSSTYQMSSVPSELAQKEDPANTLLQHMPIKRLEAEAIRDHILACSGELDTTLFGPSSEAYVDDHPDSRARPKSGPINGDARRSVYLEIRRNFLPSFLRVFDLPNATEPIGARQVTNVPAQSLALMNDPFVHEQAAAWARKMTDTKLSTIDRINELHLTAYGRPASETELNWATDFLQSMAVEYETGEDDPKVWTDLCHLMYNRKDFIYLF
ncbi:MAG: PSD1 and planctomycete cytochrome C domain-containing protein [Verrucomicrobia bacterium]|nr:PSD1 and planctomycete cytochrome C domain-containing protein [Verrucomicrobiota bacterium]MDA1068174.1 PSD1 and planctomycete cytochrome C domain-containing protein [Verrucomicrobiota bacterium]